MLKRRKPNDPWATYVPARQPLTNRQSLIGILIVIPAAALICGILIELSRFSGLFNYF